MWENKKVGFNGFMYLRIFVVLEMEARSMRMASKVKESPPGPPLKF